VSVKTVVVVGSFADSLVRFRGPLISDLVARGHRVIACAPAADTCIVAALTAIGAEYSDVRLQRAGFNPMSDLRSVLLFWRLFRQLRPDVLFAYTIKPVIYGSIAATLAGVPLRFAMITGLGFAFTDGASARRRWAGAVARVLYRVALPHCHRVFFQNPDDLELFLTQKIISKSQPVTLVPGSGVDVSEYAYAPLQSKTTF
jgi:hypothetical protein